jgi:hypothetical protein
MGNASNVPRLQLDMPGMPPVRRLRGNSSTSGPSAGGLVMGPAGSCGAPGPDGPTWTWAGLAGGTYRSTYCSLLLAPHRRSL